MGRGRHARGTPRTYIKKKTFVSVQISQRLSKSKTERLSELRMSEVAHNRPK